MNALHRGVIGVSLLAMLSGPALAFDLKSMTDSANKAVDDASKQATGAMDSASDKMSLTPETQGMVDSLTSQLGVTPKQAAGGAGAMLALAQNQLSSDQFSAITSKVPGLGALLGGGDGSSSLTSSMLSKVTSLSGVKSAFSALGLSPEMVSQFAGPMLNYLGSQGVGGTVLNSLKGLWGVAA
ncbi:hypothetical protein A11A3_00865 [Alcanivorax hongdengensis A-11-3]|uniref:DUF2780 domain-containing protein n=1 Tax=Alcanivorax hongdengensis A-11-3 TaxID=1177179 RepID=L0WG69_9GAMM|nr:DUF2780 domain-containing protein [Alcanivorax hongdengensis]EKF76001.1 hypothetical protein A11A3_00865 [Alcanivorax hongdengensis A-11-3]